MARFKRAPIAQDWNDEPEEIEETPGLEPGDMVRPLVCLMVSEESVDGHHKTKRPFRENSLVDDDGNATLDGEIHGIYIGQKRLNFEKKINHNPGHWTGTRRVKGFHELFHIFVFGGRRVIIDMKHVEKIVDEDDE